MQLSDTRVRHDIFSFKALLVQSELLVVRLEAICTVRCRRWAPVAQQDII
jgi:hypothetical protein